MRDEVNRFQVRIKQLESIWSWCCSECCCCGWFTDGEWCWDRYVKCCISRCIGAIVIRTIIGWNSLLRIHEIAHALHAGSELIRRQETTRIINAIRWVRIAELLDSICWQSSVHEEETLIASTIEVHDDWRERVCRIKFAHSTLGICRYWIARFILVSLSRWTRGISYEDRGVRLKGSSWRSSWWKCFE